MREIQRLGTAKSDRHLATHTVDERQRIGCGARIGPGSPPLQVWLARASSEAPRGRLAVRHGLGCSTLGGSVRGRRVCGRAHGGIVSVGEESETKGWTSYRGDVIRDPGALGSELPFS